MRARRIHILGASGAGTTTLGQDLATRLQCPFFDSDAYFWLPTEPPFIEKRETALRQQCLMDDLTAHDAWVLSGSLCGWGDVAIPLFELAVYLWIPPEIRLQRLRERERKRYGERIAPGGDMYNQSQAFLDWAASYDDGGLDTRSRRLHQQWLSLLPCPVVRLEGGYTTEARIRFLESADREAPDD